MNEALRRFYGTGLQAYRRSFKRFGWLHRLSYAVVDRSLRLVGRLTGFETRNSDPLSWRLALMLGSHEADTRALFADLVEPGMTVVDVGAHIGYYTRQFADLVGPSGRVVAFEPHPRNYELLVRNVRSKGNVTLVKKAASDRRQVVTLYDDMPDTGGPSLRRDPRRADQVRGLSSARELAPRAVADTAGEQFDIEAARIDEELAELDVERVDIVKMDIEGAEIGAMKGMERILAREGTLSIVFELYPAAMKPFEVAPISVWCWLVERGFRVFRIGEGAELQPLHDEAAARELIAELQRSGSEVNLLATRD